MVKKINDCSFNLTFVRKTLRSSALTDCWYGWELGAEDRGCWVAGPPTRVPHCLQLLLLQMLQALAGAKLLSEMETHHCDPAGGIFTAQGLHEGQVVQGAEVPQASPAVRRHFYSTVIVGGTAKW